RVRLRALRRQGAPAGLDRQEPGGSRRAGGDGGPRPRRLHRADLQRRVARATPLPPDGQLRHGGGPRGADDPGHGGPLRRAARVRREGAFVVVVAVLVLASPERSAGQGTESPFRGSVPTGTAEPTDLALSLKDAFARALQYTLGLIESEHASRSARAVRLRSLSALLPDLSARVSATRQTVNLQASGLRLQIPGVIVPIVVGPFSVADARGYASQEIFNWSSIKSWKSAAEAEKASRFSYRSDRDLVVYTTANAYLLVISDQATVETTRAQLKTAETLHARTVDQNKAGVVAAIDALRARVELQTQQQRLIAAENQLAIDTLALARVIGLPKGQAFHVSDAVPYAPLTGVGLDEALQQAH